LLNTRPQWEELGRQIKSTLQLSNPTVLQATPQLLQMPDTAPRRQSTAQSAMSNSTGLVQLSLETFRTPGAPRTIASTSGNTSDKIRHCPKCGKASQNAAGKAFGCSGAQKVENCRNNCQDCGLVKCKGRDTREYMWREKGRCENYKNGIYPTNM
jgi:hypothetical protein